MRKKTINAFVQARMSSSRFPGKMLAPLNGKPLIKHLVDTLRKVEGLKDVVVLTSDQESDDPLDRYLSSLNCFVYRGALENVLERYQSALNTFPCDFVLRTCGDSPLISLELLNFMVKQCLNRRSIKLFSNVFYKNFPMGQSVEIICSSLLLNVDPAKLTAEEQEHVFPYFYKNVQSSETYFLKMVERKRKLKYSVDSKEDLDIIHKLNRFEFVESDTFL